MTTDVELMSRITTRPGVLGGKPIIRDLRIAVEHIFAMLAAGDSVETILYEYPALEPEDVQACFVFAYRCMLGEHEQVRVADAT